MQSAAGSDEEELAAGSGLDRPRHTRCRGRRASSERIGNHIIKVNDRDIRPLSNGPPTFVRSNNFPQFALSNSWRSFALGG